jgi:hypothetical protein
LIKKDHLLRVIIEAPAGGRNKFAFEGEHVRAGHSKNRGKSYGAYCADQDLGSLNAGFATRRADANFSFVLLTMAFLLRAFY